MTPPRFTRALAKLLRYPLAAPTGGSGLTAVDVLTVDVEDTQGVSGLGFSYCLGFGGVTVRSAARELLEAFVIGKPCGSPLAAWQRMDTALNRVGRGAHFLALAAIDLALWDLHARQRDEPLGIALGGTPRAVPVYGSGGFRPAMSGAEVVQIAQRYHERGVRAIKLRASGARGDVEQLAAIREAWPENLEVMVDLNEKGDLDSAVALAQACAEHGVTWLEEPLPSHDLPGYRELASRCTVPLAAGEHWQGCFEFETFTESGMVSYAQPDLAMSGGLTECLRIAQRCEPLGIQISPHFLPSLFVHLAAAAPNITWLEDFPLLEPLFGDPPTFDGQGQIVMDESPGHGLALDAGAVSRYCVG